MSSNTMTLRRLSAPQPSPRRISRAPSDPSRRGTAAVEMAFVTPFLLILLIGIVEFGRAMMVSNLITNATREGARVAIREGSTSADVDTLVKNQLQQTASIDPTAITVVIDIEPAPGNPDPGTEVGNAGSGDMIKVDVSVPFNEVMWSFNKWLSGTTLSAQVHMRHD